MAHARDGFPAYRGEMEYVCQGCGSRFPAAELYYTCPGCGGVFLLEDTRFAELTKTSGQTWREIFDSRAASKHSALQGIFRFYELVAPILEPGDIVSPGEGQTPVVRANSDLEERVGRPLAFKNEGQNPSASFKDRGMACAFSYLKSVLRQKQWDRLLTVCASTGDTSASAAMYAAYVGHPVTSVVLLPQGKVTPQQLAQPLGSGARVLELPGVFDDCMKVVEYLADNCPVALLNSKNSWRILGQETYAFEVAQWSDWETGDKAVFVPVGNAGNISAIMAGFLKLHRLGIISELPQIFGVQSCHADPVYRYYSSPPGERRYEPVSVRSSAAQAAMIGDPVSFPRVRSLAERYQALAGESAFQVVQVTEQEIVEGMLQANRHGHIACTQGGESLAGLLRAAREGAVSREKTAVLNATAHSLKFQSFQQMYFEDSFPPEYEIQPRQELINRPRQVRGVDATPGAEREAFVSGAAAEIMELLGLSGD
ncbi:MAG: threonine synthase [Desulfohalobiaceae bacterium]|nr:threonine synthase [Desulfohalobiaceae bacterium]